MLPMIAERIGQNGARVNPRLSRELIRRVFGLARPDKPPLVAAQIGARRICAHLSGRTRVAPENSYIGLD